MGASLMFRRHWRFVVAGLVILAGMMLLTPMAWGLIENPPAAVDDPGFASALQKVSLIDCDLRGLSIDSVSVSGDTAVLGAQDQLGYNDCAAYVLRRSRGNWGLEVILTVPNGLDFGADVSVSGDTLAIGSPGEASGRGTVYVFTRSGTTWTQQAELTPDVGSTGDHFGSQVSLSGDTIAIGAGSDDSGRGSVYVFTRSGANWSRQGKLVAADGSTGDHFGSQVSLSGDMIAVGAPNDDSYRGSAYVFTRSGTTWTEQARLVASERSAGDCFGSALSASGDTTVIGAYGDDSLRGSAYVFTRSGAAWSQQAKLTASDGTPGDQFGNAVAVSGDAAVIGARCANGLGGSAYAYARSGAAWTQQDEPITGSSAAFDNLGDCVSLSGDTAAICTEDYVYLSTGTYKTPKDTPLVVRAPGVLANDSGAEGTTLTASLVSGTANGTVELGASGEITYTPGASWTGTDTFTYRAYDGASYSEPATVTILVTPPLTTTKRTSASKTITYGSPYVFSGTLTASSTPLAGQQVVLERSTGGAFSTASVATTTPEGTFSFTVHPGQMTVYRARFLGAGEEYSSSASSRALVRVRPYVGTPKAPRYMSHRYYYRVHGYLKPRHKAGTYPVYFYIWKKTSSGKWAWYGRVHAKASDYLAYTQYAHNIRLHEGKYRIRAYAPSDRRHSEVLTEGYDLVTVR